MVARVRHLRKLFGPGATKGALNHNVVPLSVVKFNNNERDTYFEVLCKKITTERLFIITIPEDGEGFITVRPAVVDGEKVFSDESMNEVLEIKDLFSLRPSFRRFLLRSVHLFHMEEGIRKTIIQDPNPFQKEYILQEEKV